MRWGNMSRAGMDMEIRKQGKAVRGRQYGWSDSEKGRRRRCLGKEVEMGSLGES